MKKILFRTAAYIMAAFLMVTGMTVHGAGQEQEILTAMNSERAAAGLAPLVMSQTLTEAASVRAQEASVKFSHTRPDGTDYYTVNPAVYGENLAHGYAGKIFTAEQYVAAFMASPSHRANVLYKDSTEVGIATYTNENGIPYIAVEFN